jgi:hypothetical protein
MRSLGRHIAVGAAALLLLFAVGCRTLDSGAVDGEPSTALRLANADYPVPVPVAIHAYDIDGGPMTLEGSSVRNAGFTIRAAFDGITERTRVGMELAPLLIGGGISLEEYLSSRLLRLLIRPRISFGVELSNDNAFYPSLGLRWMLHDDADLRADSTMLALLAGVSPGDRAAAVDSARAALKEELWNRSVYELAVAGSWRSVRADDGRVVLHPTGYYGAIVAGFPMLGTSGQLQASTSCFWTPLPPHLFDLFEASLTTRAYYGTASERLFVGLRLDADRHAPVDYRLELGGQLRVANGFWLRPDIGWSIGGGARVGPAASLTMSFGTPETNR